jgi:5'-3' exonuclease
VAKTILIDANSVGRASHAATKLTVGRFQTQAIFGFLRTVGALCRDYPGWQLLVLWDGRADHRYAIYPQYKEKRKIALVDPVKAADRAAYEAQVPWIKKALELLGVPQMVNSALEADDLAGYLVPRLSAKDEVLLVTGDSDWLQLVNARTRWFDPRKAGIHVNDQDFFEKTGYFSPREYIEGKALIGDSTDDIPPAGGIGKKGAPEFMAQFRSMEAFRAQCDSGAFVPKLKAHINLWKGEPRRNWERNMKLMDLLGQPHPDPTKTTITNGMLNEPAFRALCERLVFQSILREWDHILKPFRERWAARQLRAAA